jgi:hypothetical protein
MFLHALQVGEPRACCKAVTAECLSCAEGMELDAYCKLHPVMLGCGEARSSAVGVKTLTKGVSGESTMSGTESVVVKKTNLTKSAKMTNATSFAKVCVCVCLHVQVSKTVLLLLSSLFLINVADVSLNTAHAWYSCAPLVIHTLWHHS